MRKIELKPVLRAAAFAFLMLVSACSKKHQAGSASPGAQPVDHQMADSIRFRFAVYLLPGKTTDTSAVLRRTVAQKYPGLKVVDEIPKQPQAMLVRAKVQKNVQREYTPPDLKELEYSSHGLSPHQAQALQKSSTALILDFGHPKAKIWIALRNANTLIEEIARKTGGLIYDEETRDIFSPEAWHERRLASWLEEIPDISTQMTLQLYNNGEFERGITLGMAKVGLPDVVVEGFPTSSEDNVGDLINVFCQSMVEGAPFKRPNEFYLSLRAIKNANLRDSQLKSLKPHSTGIACLSLKPGKPDEDDPDNRLIQITFDKYPGPDPQAQQDSMLSSFFGWEDHTTRVHHNEELLEASRKARTHLPELQKAFNAGLQPGEYIQLKAPFETPDGGNEWMWVEVTRWQGSRIKGILANEPSEIPSLRGGQVVEVREEDVFDFIRQFPDNHSEGNTTGAILEKMDKSPHTDFLDSLPGPVSSRSVVPCTPD